VHTKQEIQKALIDLGFDLGKGGKSGKGDDGVFGDKTKAALKAFQVSKGLTPDGRYGDETEEALFPTEELDRGAVAEVMPPSMSRPMVTSPLRKPVWPAQKDVMGFYGAVGLHQTSLILPFKMKLAWDKKVLVGKITVHEKVHDSAKRAFDKVADAYDEVKRAELGIDLFGGSLNVRKMRGGNSYSMHSWGVATLRSSGASGSPRAGSHSAAPRTTTGCTCRPHVSN
jgi:hypothetical protein